MRICSSKSGRTPARALKSPSQKRTACYEEANLGAQRAVKAQRVTVVHAGDEEHASRMSKAAHGGDHCDADPVGAGAGLYRIHVQKQRDKQRYVLSRIAMRPNRLGDFSLSDLRKFAPLQPYARNVEAECGEQQNQGGAAEEEWIHGAFCLCHSGGAT
jgi:hypothetical protein